MGHGLYTFRDADDAYTELLSVRSTVSLEGYYKLMSRPGNITSEGRLASQRCICRLSANTWIASYGSPSCARCNIVSVWSRG